jgi:hypothetical protein
MTSNSPTILAILNKQSRIPEDMQKCLQNNCEKKVTAALEAKVRVA